MNDRTALLKKIDIPTLIIVLFLVGLFVLAFITGVAVPPLIGDSLRRIGMNGVLVLAMVPTIRSGIGPNFGLPIGIIGGLLGALISMQLGLVGFVGFWVAILLALVFCLPLGLGYSWILEKVRGQEMMVGTYLGYSIVAFMSIMWLLLPFSSPDMVWAIGGKGLRYTLTLNDYFGNVLNDFMKIKIGSFEIPTGLLLFFAGACLLVYLFFKTRIGLAIDLTGQNERYAVSSGVDIKKARRISVIFSTVLGGIGIIIYAQSYGFLQLYRAPLYMAFPAVACILIGGASLTRATITNVIVGTTIFQTLLTIALPVLSQVARGDITEVLRMIISNGMILYALSRASKEAS